MKQAAANHSSHSRSTGATLVELVITIVIIGVAMAGVAGAFATLVGRGADPLNQTRAVALAQLYLDEIITKPFDHSTPVGGVPAYSGPCTIGAEGGETRATFNDVDDYHGITQEVPASPTGLLSGYDNFRVSVTVSCAGTELGLSAASAKRIDLTVRTPSAQDFLFTAYRVNF